MIGDASRKAFQPTIPDPGHSGPAVAPAGHQLALDLPEPGYYLRTALQRPTHFAVLQRDPVLKAAAAAARAELEQLRPAYELLADPRGPNHDPARAAQLKKGLSALQKKSYRDKRQECFPIAELPVVLKALPPDRDTWISQSIFVTPAIGSSYRPNRRRINFASTCCAFADLDYYRAEVHHDPGTALKEVISFLALHGWPLPSFVLDSGRGLQLKWIIKDGVPRAGLPRWEALERRLIEILALRPDFGVDASVRDASRVLRLEKTLNEKANRQVEVLWVNTGPLGGATEPWEYEFDALCTSVFRWTQQQVQAFRDNDIAREIEAAAARDRYARRAVEWAAEKAANVGRYEQDAQQRRRQLKLIAEGRDTRGLRTLSGRQLAWDRLGDLQALATLRHWDLAAGGGGVGHGYRSRFVLYSLSFLALSGGLTPGDFWHEARSYVARYTPTLLATHGLDVFSTLFRKVCSFVNGERVQFGGESYVPIYTPRNATLIELFDITSDEERQLATIIGEDEKRRRQAAREMARRRAAGAVDRATYLASAAERHDRAKALRAEGRTLASIAAELGCSLSSVKNYLG